MPKCFVLVHHFTDDVAERRNIEVFTTRAGAITMIRRILEDNGDDVEAIKATEKTDGPVTSYYSFTEGEFEIWERDIQD